MADDPTAPPASMVDLVREAFTQAHRENVGATHGSLHDLLNVVLEEHEQELAAMVAPILQAHIDHPDTPDLVRDILQTVAHPEHQTQFFTALFAVRAIIDQFVFAAIAPLVQDVSNQVWPASPNMPLSPQEVALGMLRHNPHVPDPNGEAALSGVNGGRLAALAYNAGDGISIQEALLLFRRGQIDQARLQTALEQSRVRDEWLPEVLNLRYMPPPAGEVVSGLLKGHLSQADAANRLAEAGIDPANLGWLHDTAGRPPSPVESLDLWNRGYISESEVDAIVRQSDINDNFLATVKNLRWWHPPPRSIVAMHRRGTIDDATATRWYQQAGVTPDVIPLLILDGRKTSSTKVKEISEAQTLRLYDGRMITAADANARLTALGYSGADAAELVALVDEERHERQLSAAASKVRSLYVGWKIDRTQATNDLGAIGVPAAAITDWLNVWTIERQANVHLPTVAQLGMALRRDAITPAEYSMRVQALGVPADDVFIFAVDAYPVGKVPAALYNL